MSERKILREDSSIEGEVDSDRERESNFVAVAFLRRHRRRRLPTQDLGVIPNKNVSEEDKKKQSFSSGDNDDGKPCCCFVLGIYLCIAAW